MSSIEPIRATWKGVYREKRAEDGTVRILAQESY